MSAAAGRLVPLTDDVWVAVSRRYATTSTVVRGDDGGALVVDPAWDPDELEGVPAGLEALGLTCAAGLATHVHYDHVLWHPGLGAPPRWASRWTAWAAAGRRDEVLAPLVGDLPEHLIALAGRLDAVPGGRDPGDVPVPPAPAAPASALPAAYALPWHGREVVLHEHDAHAPAHVAVEVVDRRVLLAGDMASDVELPMPDGDAADLEAYLVGLDVLAAAAARCRWLVPGHGSPTDAPLARIDADRRYLDALLRGDDDPDDPRRGLEGMAELHAENVARARAERTGDQAR